MGIFSRLTNTVKRAVGVDQIKSQTAGLRKMAHEMLSIPKEPKNTETFEQALDRLQLSEADVERRKLQFQRLVSIYLIFAVLLSIYMVYLLFRKAFFPLLGCFGILLVVFSLFFRYSFWLFQMRERRLGCTFREWFYDLIGKKQ